MGMDRVNQLVGFGPSFVTFLIFLHEKGLDWTRFQEGQSNWSRYNLCSTILQKSRYFTLRILSLF